MTLPCFDMLVLVDRLGFRLPVPRSWCKVYGGDFEHLSKKQAEWAGKECCPELTSELVRAAFRVISFECETEPTRVRVIGFKGYLP
jgi:hypothetical protein